ncbi:MAG: ribulose-phosphate 3-epimerase [Planctomycetes bacterium]|nr:ribulose-phosphate 3-epimerase [Planctomycetota bacterium]
MSLTVQLGVKSDPILYRYSYPWLFRLMADSGVRHLQLGTWFEMYQLPDSFFHRLRAQAQDHSIVISSVFTAHRELGGYFQGDEWVGVARRNHERLIEVAALLGARSAGHNPGAVLRDRMGTKAQGLDTYTRHMRELMHLAHRLGVPELTVEPMSCEAEPPCSPAEQRQLMTELTAYHAAHADTAAVGYCIDIAHGWAGRDRQVKVDHIGLLEAGLPWCRELHLKNTDASYDKTFGFGPDERKKGVVDVAATRAWLEERSDLVPVGELVGYLEIGGPKLGRDYSDCELEGQLRSSLEHLRAAWLGNVTRHTTPTPNPQPRVAMAAPAVRIAPSLMCADQCHLEDEVRRLEAAGCEVLHVDIMDGAFTPNLVLGFEQLKALRCITSLPLDVHLMVEDNDLFVRLAKEAGADWVSVHAESCRHLDRTLASIRDLGMRAGAALNPATPPEMLDYVIDRLDHVLVMTVNPGFAGQRLVPCGMRKIGDVRAWLARHGSNALIEVDGNVSLQHIPGMVAAGADILVAGTSSVFIPGQARAENVRQTRAAINDGLERRNGSGARKAVAA